jgi:hypothetical protein
MLHEFFTKILPMNIGSFLVAKWQKFAKKLKTFWMQPCVGPTKFDVLNYPQRAYTIYILR